MDTPSIEAINLTRQYGRLTALSEVSFVIRKGEVVGLLGPNGAGKSTLMRIISGLLPATSGSAFIAGLSVTRFPDEIKTRIGYMPENNPLPEAVLVQEYLQFRASIKGVPMREIRHRVDEIMDLCDLRNKAARRQIGKLSKGFRQRVGIADALLAQPEVVIMDEPTIGLDPHQIRAVRNLIDRMRGRMTVILSSHILHEIDTCCDRSLIINRGRIVASGTLSQMRKRYSLGASYHLKLKGEIRQIDSILPSIHASLKRVGTDPADEEGFHLVKLAAESPDDLGHAIISAIVSQPCLKLKECYRNEPDLEDVFLAATKRSWDETSGTRNTDDPASTPPVACSAGRTPDQTDT
ncbi:MAG TPA: ABC transporter ATP-binding protein [Opitutales bacterium]|nr:ABC transporter ATP-binding protein [Opitutales bacterium]